MTKAKPVNFNVLAMRLLALGQLGCHIRGFDGHFWIMQEEGDYIEPYHLYTILKEHGIKLNDKIYGGVLEALDTIDFALERCGKSDLYQHGIEYAENQLELGNGGIDTSRIDFCEKGRGGIV